MSNGKNYFGKISHTLSMRNYFSKFFKLVRLIWFGVLSAPIVLLLRLVRPAIRIRLGVLDIGRLGGSFDLFWYLICRDLAAPYKYAWDFFYFTPTDVISNNFWVAILARELKLFAPTPFLSKLLLTVCRLNKFLPHSHLNEILFPATFSPVNEVIHAAITNPRVLLQFTREEDELGIRGIVALGIPVEGQFVCFHARDSSYLNDKHPGIDWQYHDYRDSKIGNYIPAAEELCSRGLWAVRVGEIALEPIISSNKAVIDYTYSGTRSEFMDIYLGAKCKFMIISDTGLFLVPTMFRRPIVFVNWVLLPLIHVWSTGVVITKKFFSVSKNRLLTYREILSREEGVYGDLGLAAESGIQLVENSPAEIQAAAVEMNERIDGLWADSKEDIALQNRFWEIFGADRLRNPELRIGAEFLRSNTNLLA